MSEELVRELPDLFELEPEPLEALEGFAEKSATNLVEAIGKAAKTELRRFLYGLGIPEVGTAVARDLAEHFRSFEKIRDASEEELEEVEGIGPKMTEGIRAFFEESHNRHILDRLLDGRVTLIEPVAPAEGGRPLEGLTFVFTGGLERFSRSQAKELVEANGARATSSVSGDTDYVVVGEDPGSKLEEARERGVNDPGRERLPGAPGGEGRRDLSSGPGEPLVAAVGPVAPVRVGEEHDPRQVLDALVAELDR